MRDSQACLRIFDANYNRAKEALRVCEDIARFFWDDTKLTGAFKGLRHRLTKILLSYPVSYRKLLEARDSVSDVGRGRILRDRSNTKIRDVFAANLQRAEEAVRVMEEISKIVSPGSAGQFERARFKLYELEKKSFRKF